MAKKTDAKRRPVAANEADPRFLPVVKAFARAAGFSLMESKSGAMRGLMLHGKSFGMSSNGRFILKFTEDRAATLVSDGVGRPFSPSPDRLMKGWVEIDHPKADWVALAKEALLAARDGSKRARK